MRAVVQRVSEASVEVGGETTGAIQQGLLVLLAVHEEDTRDQLEWVADKVAKLRIFQDDQDKMNLSVSDVDGAILVVSQFTLYGSVKKGTRPSFVESAQPDKAEAMYEEFVEYLRSNYDIPVETGKFAAMMDVKLVNDGPVTLIVEK